jgi:hypothetical protein
MLGVLKELEIWLNWVHFNVLNNVNEGVIYCVVVLEERGA